MNLVSSTRLAPIETNRHNLTVPQSIFLKNTESFSSN